MPFAHGLSTSSVANYSIGFDQLFVKVYLIRPLAPYIPAEQENQSLIQIQRESQKQHVFSDVFFFCVCVRVI